MARSQDDNGDGGRGGGGGSDMTPTGTTTSPWTSTLPPGWTRDPDGTIHGPGGGTFSNTGATITNPWPSVDPSTALISTLNNGTMGYGDQYVTGFNTNYGLPSGSSLAYYADQNIYSLPSGYASVDPNTGKWTWTARGAGGGGGNTISTQPVGSLAGLPQAAPSAALAGGPGNGANAQALYDFLVGRMNTSLKVDPNDPTIKDPTDVYAATQMQNWRNAASALAEHGGANFNPDAENRAAAEQLGTNVASYQANLMQQELAARRNDIQQAITQAAGLLTSEQQMSLEDELTKIDEQLKLTGLNMGDSEFLKTLAQRAFEFDTNNYNSVYGG